MSQTRYERIMSGAARDAARYRANPAQFAHDYLHLDLLLFQKILLTMMNVSTTFTFIGCRGIGKTYLSAVFCVIRCILYPGTKIVVASGKRGQALNVLEKVMLELKPNSKELAAEIDDKQTRTSGQNAQIVFRNSSFIKVVTASDSARGNRANILLLDEFRLINRETIDLVLSKFLTQQRRPKYSELSKAEKQAERDKEKNMTLYLSSAFTTDHWSYQKCETTMKAMVDDKRRQFVCGLPYQLSIAEGLLDQDRVEEEMMEADFSLPRFQMEYEALWWGNTDDAFFDYSTISKNRKIKYPMLPDKLAAKLGNNKLVQIPPKNNGEVRILSADIALMSSKRHKNDATAIFINELKPTKAGRYVSNIVYAETCEGLRTDDQALVIRKLYDEFSCDYIVLDCSGLGIGIFDMLASDIADRETGEIYPALSCCNNSEMASRCTTVGAEKAIWAIKASAQFNSDCAVLLRDAFQSGRIRLLWQDYEADGYLEQIKGYSGLSEAGKIKIKMPYINTTLLVDELTKLQHEMVGTKVRVYEKTGMRKDRYSSLAYNYYVAVQLEKQLSRRRSANSSSSDMFIIKPPKYKGGGRSSTYGGNNHYTSWR